MGTAVALSAVLSGCAGPLSALDPAGPAAASIASIWYAMLIGGTLLFVLVLALFALAFLRPQWNWSEASGTRWLLFGGLVMPVAVLTALMIYALSGGERLLAHPGPGNVTRVEARAERWRWVFSYPGVPGAGQTIDALHIPAGRPVDVAITSADVIHSFWIPRLAGKLDAIPGHENVLRIVADRPGTFAGQCSEYCGIGHRTMMFTVEAHEPGNFEAAVATAAGEGAQ